MGQAQRDSNGAKQPLWFYHSKFSTTWRISSQLILREHEKVLLKRYIQNEKFKPDFLDEKDYKQIRDEVMLFAYFAGHGCSDPKQVFVLNEDSVDEAFWTVE